MSENIAPKEERILSDKVADKLPPSIRRAVLQMSAEQQIGFEEDYLRRKRDPWLYLLIAIFFPIQHFLLGKLGIGLIFILTGGLLGIWWFIEILYTPLKRIPEANEELARELARDAKLMGA